MQGMHKEVEFRQLEIWTWKSYIRPPILHNYKQDETSRRLFMKYMMNIGANNYERGPTRWALLGNVVFQKESYDHARSI